MSGLAGITLVSGETKDEFGALVPRNLGATNGGASVGVFIESTPEGTEIEARTANSVYRLRHLGKGAAEISGHPKYCPRPVRVQLRGTQWLDRSLNECYVAPGMQLQFVDPSGRSVLTSKILSVGVVR